MARPQKIGLDYFPFDVDFFENDKIKLVSAEFGGWKAEFVIIRLLAKIYRNGYYYKWGKDECLLLSKAIGVVDCSSNYIQEVVAGLVRRRFFDEGCYKQSGVLTSISIQEVYLKATAERIPLLDKPFWLLSDDKTPKKEDNPPINVDNPPINSKNRVINTQSKVKKRIIKKATFVAPSIEEFRGYFVENGFSAELAERAFRGYDVAGWCDSRGKQIKNWKQKCVMVWFTPENKNKIAKSIQPIVSDNIF